MELCNQLYNKLNFILIINFAFICENIKLYWNINVDCIMKTITKQKNIWSLAPKLTKWNAHHGALLKKFMYKKEITLEVMSLFY